MYRFVGAFVFLVAIGAARTAEAVCPPPGYDSVANFDPEKFISASWYVQQQAVVAYQGPSTMYCVVATYEPKKGDIKNGLKVCNYANRYKVNGPAFGTSGSGGSSASPFDQLEAVIPNFDDPSKLLVGIPLLGAVLPKSLIYGDYWVVGLGEDDNGDYTWAIISAGAPEVPSKDGTCKTVSTLLAPVSINGAGLWLFSRKPVDPEATAEMRSFAKDLGLDISVLLQVEQEGCLYEGAIIK